MRFPGRVSKTTPNMLRAKERKERNRKLRDKADAEEASRLGITVDELKFKRFKETQKIIADAAERERRLIREALPRRRSSSYGYY